MSKKLLLSLSFLLLISSSPLLSDDALDADLSGFEESSNESDVLDGFDDAEDIPIIQEVQKSSKKEYFTLGGDLAFKTAYGYRDHKVDGVEYGGFNQAQTSLYLQLDSKLSDDWKLRISGDAFYDAIYDIHGYPYNRDVIDTYRTQLRFDDTYIQGGLTHNLDLKVGRQIVVWGKSDSIRITDVINPLDNRLPGLTDIKDLRLSVGMAKLDYYIDKWNLSAMIIPENRIFLEAAPRGEFFPVEAVFPSAPNPFIELKQPEMSWDNMQYAFAANGIFSGWDLSFYGADVLDSKWHLEATPTHLSRVVSKIKMLGTALNIAYGSWLLKSEIAFKNGVRYNSTRDAKDRFDALLGFDYMGISDTVLSLELANKHIFDYEQQMSATNIKTPDYVDQDELQTALRATRSFSNDTINANALVSMFGQSWEYGGFARVWVEYEVRGGVNANVGIVEYISGDRPFAKAISNNDRVFADITYSF